MNIFNKRITIIVTILIFILHSCSSEDKEKYIPPTLLNFPETGLLGQPILIKVENVEHGKLQVFFDLEEAEVHYISDTEIEVIVPRTIKRNNPTLKVIDLNENTTILEKTFLLKKPIISKYSAADITFNETLIIYGENFDNNKDFISVLVNNEAAVIVKTDYDKIEIQIPKKITKADLDIKVKSQLQETSSSLALTLKNPVIRAIQGSGIWLQQYLYVDIENVNPDEGFGEILINGIPAFFNVNNNKVEVSIPPGPYKDFTITSITYKTAGLTSSYDFNLDILNDFILVDNIANANIQHTIFKHNNKAYVFKYTEDRPSDFNRKYALLEFSSVTEKWTELSNFQYSGYIVDAAYDGEDTVYLYKMSVASQSFTLTKLDLHTFKETAIDLPSNKIVSPILFAYQDNLYLLSGLNNIDGKVSVRNQKYKYSETTNSWTELANSAFSSLPLVDRDGGNPCKYFFNGNDIYISYGISYKTYKISPNLDVTTYPYRLYLEYGDHIMGTHINYYNLLFNIKTNASKTIDLYSLAGYSDNFFTLNNEVYYLRNSWSAYYQNTVYTQKLNKKILNGLF